MSPPLTIGVSAKNFSVYVKRALSPAGKIHYHGSDFFSSQSPIACDRQRNERNGLAANRFTIYQRPLGRVRLNQGDIKWKATATVGHVFAEQLS
jgi:hypothetical protein